MMEKKRIFKALLTLFILVALLHNIFHFSIFGTGIHGLNEKGISGLIISEVNLGENIRNNYGSLSTTSKIILIIEWGIIMAAFIFIYVRNKIEMKKEVENITSPKKYKRSGKSTDLDALYNLLKEKKHLRLSTITKVFKVEKDIALNWARTLENAGLIEIHYPKIGEPEIVLSE